MKTIFTSLGFILFLLGFLAFVLSLVGIKFYFLTFIDSSGATTGLLIRLAMIIGGVVMVILAQTDWTADENEM